MNRLHPRFWPDHARAAAAHPRTPDVASVVLVALVGWQLAGPGWILLPGPATATADVGAGPAADAAAPPTDARPDPGAQLARLHLFGEPAPEETDGTSPDAGADAPETQLDLDLKGLYAPGDGRGFAIIAAGNGPEQVYAIDDTIAGGARITGIFDDRVVLRRNGQAETLRLPHADAAPTAPVAQRAAEPDAGVATDADSIARRAGELRARLTENPLEMARMVRFQPYVEDGSLVGYRIQPRAAEAEVLHELGIKATDVVTRINDISLNDPQQASRALQMLREARMIDITLLRDGRSRRLSIPIGNPG